MVFLGYATEGVREGHHKKSNSINDITNQIKSSSTPSSNKYSGTVASAKVSSSMHSHGMMFAPEEAAQDESFSGASAWTTKSLVSKFSGAISSISADRSLLKTTPPLSQGSSADALEDSSRYKGVFQKDLRALTSSQPHYINMRDTGFSSDFSDGGLDRDKNRSESSSNYQKLESAYVTSSSSSSSSNAKSAGLSSLEAPYSQRREKPPSNNFGLEEAPEEQFYGRRYSNI